MYRHRVLTAQRRDSCDSADLASTSTLPSALTFAVRAVVFRLRVATECELGSKGSCTSGSKLDFPRNRGHEDG